MNESTGFLDGETPSGNRSVAAGLIAVALFGCVLCAGNFSTVAKDPPVAAAAEPLKLGRRAPGFWAHTASGQIVHIHDDALRTKWVLVEFWDSTARKRARDQAVLQALRKEFLDEERLVIFSVCVDLEFGPWVEYVEGQDDFVRDDGSEIKFYSDARWWQLSLGVTEEAQRRQLMETYRLAKTPRYFLIRPDETLAAADIGPDNLKTVLSQHLAQPPK